MQEMLRWVGMVSLYGAGLGVYICLVALAFPENLCHQFICHLYHTCGLVGGERC